MTATATSEVVPRKDQREKIRNKFQHFFLLVEHFLGGASGKESACHAGDARDLGLIPGSQTYKLDLEKAEEPEIKLPTSTRSRKRTAADTAAQITKCK